MLKRILKYLIALFLATVWLVPVFALPPVESDGNASIASGTHTVQLNGSYPHCVVWLSSGSSTAYLTFNPRAATTSDALIDSGGGFAYGMGPNAAAISSFTYYGNGTTGKYSWMAW